ncbi:response regulator [Notoacmeibacter ruber]|uniref:Response regulator n=1 Tax=Notoacmeibacter ruber TaxID=2670375 RepID=A0A3L7JCI2_9HYPH|nr:response regulator [Notoacmeibacter ruber]RLQ88373.1 response regulator [Notoacmeibacter ruber]
MQRCLIIDDAPVVRKVASRILSTEDMEVEVADSASAGLSIFSEMRPDIILLDDWLPDMRSVDFLQSLQTMTGGAMPLVFLMVVEVDPVPIMRAKRAGADGWILKPFDRPQMMAALRKNIDLALQRREKQKERAA